MGNLEVVETDVISNPNRFTLFVIVFLITGTALTMYLFFWTGSFYILCFGIFFFFGFPFIFQRLFRKGFSKNVLVSFTKEYFSVEFKDAETDRVFKTDINRFDQIKLFKTYDSSKNDFSNLKLIFKNGTKLSYTFSGQKNDDICETDINWLLRSVVETYNASRKMEEKIRIIPSFFSTKAALYLGLLLTLAMATVTIYFGIQKPKALVVSIGFTGIFFQNGCHEKKSNKRKKINSAKLGMLLTLVNVAQL